MFSVLDALFPKRSLEGREGEWMTSSERVRLFSRPRHFGARELQSLGMGSLDAAFALSTYGDCPFLRRAIHRCKYRRLPDIGALLAHELLTVARAHVAFRSDSCLCPVSLHWTRLFHRGFNQAEILARILAEGTALPLRHLLRRIRPTGHQARRRREERLRAVHGAFALQRGSGFGLEFGSWWRMFPHDPDPNPIPLPFAVYLVDDLFTTGATLEACAKVLKAAGVKRVEGIVLAHD